MFPLLVDYDNLILRQFPTPGIIIDSWATVLQERRSRRSFRGQTEDLSNVGKISAAYINPVAC